MTTKPQKHPYPLYVDKDCESHNHNNYSFEQDFRSVVELLQHKKNVLVLAGAGISVSCGIGTDFS